MPHCTARVQLSLFKIMNLSDSFLAAKHQLAFKICFLNHDLSESKENIQTLTISWHLCLSLISVITMSFRIGESQTLTPKITTTTCCSCKFTIHVWYSIPKSQVRCWYLFVSIKMSEMLWCHKAWLSHFTLYLPSRLQICQTTLRCHKPSCTHCSGWWSK